MVRKSCFNIYITDDDSPETVESFTLKLESLNFFQQSIVKVQPYETQIDIVDDDGIYSMNINFWWWGDDEGWVESGKDACK